ncbi:hypothetical protein F4804DRAFT_336465 [Jackrogersella minutella]|nr:hypothetical protein F4804DRAFT_336465 [Jackrogersella minutella]
MFSRWSFTSTSRHGEPSSHHRDERRHRSRHRDPARERRRIDLVDLDGALTNRDLLNIGLKESWGLEHVADVLKKRYPGGVQHIPGDAEIQFFWVDKRVDGDEIPLGASSLLYRVLEAGDNGALRIIWRGAKLKLRKHQIEIITREVAAGRSVGSIRETTANILRACNETKGHLVKNANQVMIEAAGGLRSGPLEGNNWEVRKVQTWLCRYLIIDVVPADDYFVLQGFNEEYIWHKPYHNSHGYADVYRLRHWLKGKVLTTIYISKPHRRGIDIEDIRLVYRGKPVKKHNHIRPGEAIDFDVPRVVEDRFIRAEAWLVPISETCIVCSDEKRVSEMPNKRKITASCEHDSSICKECVGSWIASSMDTVTWDRLKCPECPQLLKYENVRAFATREIFERYDALAAKAFLSNIPDFVWCLNTRCNSGQIHPEGCERARCHVCKHSLCVRHKVPWHKGETCGEYERRTRKQRKNDMASEKHVKEITKPCPGCNRNVHKYTGCDHVTCICGHEWCWLCFGGYYRDDHDFLQCHHTRQCRYHDNPPNYEGGRAFMPFLNVGGRGPPPPPPPLFAGGGPPRERRAEAAPQAGPGNRPPGPHPHIQNADFVDFFLRRHMDRNPFDPNININLVRPHQGNPMGPDFFEEALLFNLGHLMQRAERDR